VLTPTSPSPSRRIRLFAPVLACALVLALACSPATGPADLEGTGDCSSAAWADARHRMAQRQIAGRGIQDPAVLAAMRSVPRHCFVPRELQGRAYADCPLPIGEGQTISQPYIVALMTEMLDPQPTHRVLEIGTGSGYQAAVLARLVDRVFTVEIVPTLARQATARMRTLGIHNVQVRQGDGRLGWAEQAPFDSILVTAAAETIPPRLVEQLKPGGRLVMPVGAEHAVQRLTVLTKDRSGSVIRQETVPVRFVPLVGGP